MISSSDTVKAASSAGATWLSILSILILCVAPARFKYPGVGSTSTRKISYKVQVGRP